MFVPEKGWNSGPLAIFRERVEIWIPGILLAGLGQIWAVNIC